MYVSKILYTQSYCIYNSVLHCLKLVFEIMYFLQYAVVRNNVEIPCKFSSKFSSGVTSWRTIISYHNQHINLYNPLILLILPLYLYICVWLCLYNFITCVDPCIHNQLEDSRMVPLPQGALIWPFNNLTHFLSYSFTHSLAPWQPLICSPCLNFVFSKILNKWNRTCLSWCICMHI